MSKFTAVALAATFFISFPAQQALAQKVHIKASDGITTRGSKKAQLEANTWLNEGDKLRDQGLYDDAVKKYQKALKAYPMEADTYKNMGGTYVKMGKLKEAEEILKQGSRLFPKDWLMWNNLAVVLLQSKKNDECAAALTKALACHPPEEKVAGMKDTLKTLSGSKTATR